VPQQNGLDRLRASVAANLSGPVACQQPDDQRADDRNHNGRDAKRRIANIQVGEVDVPMGRCYELKNALNAA
jgi:hypothetical protein